MSSNPRDRLPFRQIARCFLKTKDGKILAQKTDASTGTFVTVPGGGVDDGENVMAAAERELLEETGAVLDGKLTHFVSVKWIWYKEMGDTPKRRERYAQFQGEEIHGTLMSGVRYNAFVSRNGCMKTEACLKHLKDIGAGNVGVLSFLPEHLLSIWRRHGFDAFTYQEGKDWSELLRRYDTVVLDDCWVCDAVSQLLTQPKTLFVLLYQLPLHISMITKKTAP